MDARSPRTVGGTPVSLHVYVEDVDGVFERAARGGRHDAAAGRGQVLRRPLGSFEDPFGHRWHVATHVEDVPPDEMEKRAAAAMSA